MKCDYCGAELTPDQKFCMYCGTKQQRQEAPAAAPAAPADVFEAPEYPDDLNWSPAYDHEEEAVPPAPAAAAAPAAPRPAASAAPMLQLPTGRGLGKMFFLGILTLGIYPVVIWSRIVTELNLAASRYDGKRTMPYFAMCALALVTLGIYPLVWIHKFCGRIGAELKRRNIDYRFGAKTFWLWNVLGSLILVGPFIFTHKLMKSMNRINAEYNICG